ncbi:MAG: hypothetical protein JWO52_70 [Gammaproteobacteria bacterium]|nr:hypothetical protein [Gammaproteobacteria bacterium]
MSRMCRKWLKTSYLVRTVAICRQFSIYYRCAWRARVPTGAKDCHAVGGASVGICRARRVVGGKKTGCAARVPGTVQAGFRRCSGSRAVPESVGGNLRQVKLDGCRGDRHRCRLSAALMMEVT